MSGRPSTSLGAVMPSESCDPPVPADSFGEARFRQDRGGAFEEDPAQRESAGRLADTIVHEIRPRTVLDVGRAPGLLVETLRQRGVEAWGLDVSPHALDRTAPDPAPFCRTGSVLEPIGERYDLVVCRDVLEFLPAADAAGAIDNLCAAGDDVLFSSAADARGDESCVNAQPAHHWAALFARRQFLRDLEFEAVVLPADRIRRFRRSDAPAWRVVAEYERILEGALAEVAALRARGNETRARLAARERELAARPDVASLQETIGDQRRHLEALSVRLEYMSDRESELRALLHDAHEQLLQRDEWIAGTGGATPATTVGELHGVIGELHGVIEERTAWAERMVSEAEQRLEIIRAQESAIADLRQVIEERTAWAERMVREAERRLEIVEAQRATIESLEAERRRFLEIPPTSFWKRRSRR